MSEPQKSPAAPERVEPPAEFLALLAHELRNPLAPIRNGSVLLRTLCSDPRQLQVIDMISRNVVALTRMLDDLLGVASLHRGSVRPEQQCVDIARFYKIRYIHLHMSDENAWTFPSTKFPQLGKNNFAWAGGEKRSVDHARHAVERRNVLAFVPKPASGEERIKSTVRRRN